MGKKDPRIDAYIADAAEFAKPILAHLRNTIHSAHPEIDETLKWSMPHFTHNGIMCGMAAFKHHCTLGFWKGALILKQKAGSGQDEGMGQFGRITKLSDLPCEKILIGYVREAVRLNDAGIKVPSTEKRQPKPPIPEPDYFLAALKKSKKASAAYEAFSPSHRREYMEWITEAKAEETRKRRLAQAIEWMASGKSRNWKYEKC